MKIVVIGSGISAQAALFKIGESQIKADLTCISGDDFITACTYKTTSIVSLRETKTGLSDLGDLKVKSFAAFESFFQNYQPSGVELTSEEQWWHEAHPKIGTYERRFKALNKIPTSQLLPQKKKLLGVTYPAYVIEPVMFSVWLMQNFKGDFLKDVVVEVKDHYCLTLSGKKIFFDVLIDTTGHSSQFHQDCEFWSAFLAQSKKVSGTYLRFPNINLNKKSFSVCYHDCHLIYRNMSREFLVGTANVKENCEAPQSKIFSIWDELKDNFELPHLENPIIETGVRLKGPKRMPFWGQIKPNIFAINGMYKNGFSFAFLAGSDVAKEIQSL
jgi:hypothetical protein